jgi:hypothetical protein
MAEHEHAGPDEALLHITSPMDARNCFDLLFLRFFQLCALIEIQAVAYLSASI